IIITVAGAIATVAVVLAASWFGGNDPDLPHLIIVASLAIVPNLLLTILRGAASGLHRWRSVALEQFVSSAAELVALVVLAFVHQLTPLTGTVVLSFSPITGVIAYLRVRRHAPGDADPQDPLGGPRYLVGYGLRIWIGALSGIVLSRLDQAVMTPLSSEHQLGLY
ncbi:MAG: oligosaccharide flippase family protein, partial [Actinobacteria bacterium]|nr:oligosaccharide flippase family protein [Actinomycetota bacterium]